MTESISFWSAELLPTEMFFPFIVDAIILDNLAVGRALTTGYSFGGSRYPISGRLNRFHMGGMITHQCGLPVERLRSQRTIERSFIRPVGAALFR
jgi:hypothetical protein